MKTTILNRKMNTAATPSEAWEMGDVIFCAAEAEEYKALSKEELRSFLESASSLQKKDGMVYLYEDEMMPRDARTDIICKPSYAVSAIAIYAYQKHLEIFNDKLKGFMHNLLEGTFRNGITGHGYEAGETVRRTMLMLCKAGASRFVEACWEEYPAFEKAVCYHMSCFVELAKRIDDEKCIVTASGFSDDSINHLIKELVAYWNGNVHPVFVYGTLMKGERANYMLEDAEFAGNFMLKDYAMFSLGSYPGIRPCQGESVYGELYFVNKDTLVKLDSYEGEGSLYRRTKVQVCAGRNRIAADAYVYNHNTDGCRKLREKWNARDEDLVWYAGYGSNLSTDRFMCYISGGICVENGRLYPGSSDKTPPIAVRKCNYHGKLYFGNRSSAWNGCGAAFFDLDTKNSDGVVHMKCYLITRRQLHDVMLQEGKSPEWYGRLVCLDVDDKGIPVYTLTSETHRPENAPSPAYVEMIAKVLQKEFKLGKRQVMGYLGIRAK